MEILIVEDNEAVATGMAEALRLLDPGKSLHIASSLGAARDYLRHGKKVDVALVDLGLPDAAGIEAPAALRMIDPDMAIIVISGSDTSHLTLDLLRSGVQDFLPKGEASAGRILHAIGTVRHRQKRERKLLDNILITSRNGALNKLGFYVALRRCVECAARLRVHCGLLAVELRGLEKAVHDHGQAAAEIVLRQACGRVSHVIRDADALGSGDNEVLYVLLNGLTGLDGLQIAADKIRHKFDTPLHVNVAIRLTARIGGALYPGSPATVREWLERTHRALDQARGEDSDAIVICEPDSQPAASR